ncbi:MAG: M48 family metalloprotease, partial [Acidobacteriaceae bacterium]
MSHWRTALTFGDTAFLLLALWMLVRMRVGRWIAEKFARVSRRAWVQGLLIAPVWLVILTVLELPGSMIGHHVGLAYGLSVESWPAWWMDWMTSLGLTLLVGTLALSILYALLRHAPKRWWIWFWGFTAIAVVVGTLLAPLVVDPLFNHFEPLAKTDPALVARLEQVAARGGLQIPPDRIFLMDASRRYTSPNAYVTGIGASKRIVVWDTTLKEESPNEILFTYGHEQGHYVLHHIPKGLAYSAVVIFFFLGVGSRLLTWMV